MYPDQAPWTEDYWELMDLLHPSRLPDPEFDDPINPPDPQ